LIIFSAPIIVEVDEAEAAYPGPSKYEKMRAGSPDSSLGSTPSLADLKGDPLTRSLAPADTKKAKVF
jgi:hypothetical protein